MLAHTPLPSMPLVVDIAAAGTLWPHEGLDLARPRPFAVMAGCRRRRGHPARGCQPSTLSKRAGSAAPANDDHSTPSAPKCGPSRSMGTRHPRQPLRCRQEPHLAVPLTKRGSVLPWWPYERAHEATPVADADGEESDDDQPTTYLDVTHHLAKPPVTVSPPCT